MALEFLERDRRLPRARSAVQRFPVMEWRQRTEEFHSRDPPPVDQSPDPKPRGRLGWESGPFRPIADHDDWNPTGGIQTVLRSPRTCLVQRYGGAVYGVLIHPGCPERLSKTTEASGIARTDRPPATRNTFWIHS